MGSGIAPPSQYGGSPRNRVDGQTSLDEFADDAGPSDQEGRTIDERRRRIQDVLDDELDIVESHQFGSFTRGTMVGPLDENSDTDVMFVLDHDSHGEWANGKNGARNCLRAVKRALEKKYPNSDISIDRNVVAVKFHDFTVEVAPAFKDSDGGYRIPDTYSGGRSWVRTDPRGYKQRFDAVDNARNGRLKKVVRVAKKFRSNRNLPVSSYHMEVMAYNYVHYHPDNSASTEELVEGFFEQLPRRISRGSHDPVNGDRVDSNMDRSSRREAIKKAQKARKKVREAKAHRELGDSEKADEKYGEALGEEVDS